MTDKSRNALLLENTQLRNLLREIQENPNVPETVQAQIKDLLWEQDRRKQRGFENEAVRASGPAASRQRAEEDRKALSPLLTELHNKGLTPTAMARELNTRQIPTPRGKEWSAGTVRNLLLKT